MPIRMKRQTKPLIFWLGFFLLFIPGLVHAYLLMPFPGSQDLEAIKLCYYLEKIILPLRIIGGLILLWYLFKFYSINRTRGRVFKAVMLILGLGSFYITDYHFKASSMFEEPREVKFAY